MSSLLGSVVSVGGGRALREKFSSHFASTIQISSQFSVISFASIDESSSSDLRISAVV